MSAGRVCSRIVATAGEGETLRTAAQRMARAEVGTLVILETSESKRPIGILTDRDIVLRCVAHGLDPETTTVVATMTKPVHSVDEYTPIEEAALKMARAGTRRLVVTGPEGRVVGILSLDDLLVLLTKEAGAIEKLLVRQAPKVMA